MASEFWGRPGASANEDWFERKKMVHPMCPLETLSDALYQAEVRYFTVLDHESKRFRPMAINLFAMRALLKG